MVCVSCPSYIPDVRKSQGVRSRNGRQAVVSSSCGHSTAGERTVEVVVIGDRKPPAQLARVVAPPSHLYERRGGLRRLFFAVRDRPR